MIKRETNEQYSQSQGIRATALKQMLKSPAHYKAALTVSKTSKALTNGQLVHSACLEQDLSQFVARPVDESGSLIRSNSKQYQEFLKASEGKTAVKQEELDEMLSYLTAFTASKQAMRLYNNSDIESSVYSKCIQTGLLLKARPDILNLENGFVADLKTTSSDLRNFEREIFRFNYHIQAAHYLKTIEHSTGVQIKDFYFIAIEKSEVLGVQVFKLSFDLLKYSFEKWQQLINQVRACEEDKAWPSYPEIITEVQMPKYLNDHNDDFNWEVA